MTDELFNFDSDFGARYDAFVRQVIFGYDQMFPMLLAFLSQGLSSTARVLVVGSGTGMELVTFGSRMPKWTLTGVEPSKQMLGLAKLKLEKENLSDRVRLHPGKIDSLIDSELYDAATLTLVLHFVPDDGGKRALLQDIADHLKPGSPFVLVDMGGDPESDSYDFLDNGWKNYLIQNGQTATGLEQILKRRSETQYFIPETRVRELLAETGFTRVNRFYQAFMVNGWAALKT